MTKSARFLPSHKTSENLIEEVWYSPAATERGCFVEGTTVLRGNYEGLNIRDVSKNTVYLGGGGNTGQVSGEDFKFKTNVPRLIYGFNGQKPFFTADHPFDTQQGWRAIDPTAAKKITPWLDIGQLEVGDYVKRLSAEMGPDGFKYKLDKVVNITMENLPTDSMLYGLHTRAGPRSYHVNGYLVYMHSAEILAEALGNSVARLFKSEAQSVVDRVIKPLISDMHGEKGKPYLEAIMNKLKDKSTDEKAHVPIEEVVLIDIQLSYDDEVCSFPTKMSLIRGQVHINGEYVESGTILNDHQVTWTQHVDGGLQHGCLQLNPDRRSGYGRVSLPEYPRAISASSFVGKSIVPNDRSHNKFTAKLPENVYNCKIGVTPLVKGKAVRGDKMVDWGTLIVGYVFDSASNRIRPSGQVIIPPLITTPALSENIIFSVDKTTHSLTVYIKIPSDYGAVGVKYVHMQGVFNWDNSILRGTATEYDQFGVEFEGETFEWIGQIVYSEAAQAALHQSRNASVLKQKSSSKVPMLAMQSPMLTAMPTTQYPLHPDAVALADASRTQDLSLMELFTLTAPPQSEVHSLTFDLIKEMMSHELPDDVRSDILGTTKPDIGNLEGAASRQKKFLVDQFGVSYIGFALSKNSHFKDAFTEDEKNKMLYFWSGDNEKSLSSSKEYHNINTEVSTYAYVKETEKTPKIYEL